MEGGPRPGPAVASKLCEGKKADEYAVAGFKVRFPYKPYGTQLAFIGKVLTTLDSSRLQGHANALLEAPTGSGKTLALLCAALAWQQHYRDNKLWTVRKEAASSGEYHGEGGFLRGTPDPGVAAEAHTAPEVKEAEKEKPCIPKIFYGTRTHSQISQVVRELHKSGYKVAMAILAARKHYCTNKAVLKKQAVDQECKMLIKDTSKGCSYFRNMHKVKGHASLRPGGTASIHDIEDLVALGQSVKGCAYYAARAMASDAELVLCPYNYLVDPVIRRAMEINLTGAVVIIDEAHNIEDVAREAASFAVDLGLLTDLGADLERMVLTGLAPDIYQPLAEMMQEMIAWLRSRAHKLVPIENDRGFSVSVGDDIIQELALAGLNRSVSNVLRECAKKAVSAATEADPKTQQLNGLTAATLEGLFTSLTFLLDENKERLRDFRLVVQKIFNQDAGMSKVTFNLWCLNPAVAFDELAKLSRSIILTSGTLSPLDSFATELGIEIATRMEGCHVVDIAKQVWAGALSTGPQNVALNSTYKHADSLSFQDSLGKLLEDCSSIVPDGLLVFFTSYKLLDKLCVRWHTTGQWSRINAKKPLFREPRGNDEEFEKELQRYYVAIQARHQSSRLAKKGRQKLPIHRKPACKATKGPGSSGAIFLAVCRGKVILSCFATPLHLLFSLALTFKYKLPLTLTLGRQIVVGIPYPNVKDPEVNLKKRYNDENCKSRPLLSGDEWYRQQAFRAINQAIGRCIRHRNDYGAILLLDERFKKQEHVNNLSRWLRNSVQHHSNYEASLQHLADFFAKLEDSPRANCKALTLPLGEPRMFPIFTQSAPPVLKEEKESNAAKPLLGNIRRLPLVDVQNVLNPSSCKLSRTDTDSKCEPLLGKQFAEIHTKVAIDSCQAASKLAAAIRSVRHAGVHCAEKLCVETAVPCQQVSLCPSASSAEQSLLLRDDDLDELLQACLEDPAWDQPGQKNSQSNTQATHPPMQSLAVPFSQEKTSSPLGADGQAMASKKVDQEDGSSQILTWQEDCEKLIRSPHSGAVAVANHPQERSSQDCQAGRALTCRHCSNLIALVKSMGSAIDAPDWITLCKVFITRLARESYPGNATTSHERVCCPSDVSTDLTRVLYLEKACALGVADKKSSGSWVVEDGCVWSSVCCRRCNNFVGAHVLAADMQNQHLLDKLVILDQLVLDKPLEVDGLQTTHNEQWKPLPEMNTTSKLRFSTPWAGRAGDVTKRQRLPRTPPKLLKESTCPPQSVVMGQSPKRHAATSPAKSNSEDDFV
eukprot:SM000019S04984  [mRNA]  locus=s19:321229:329309:- [translate_table: standard]